MDLSIVIPYRNKDLYDNYPPLTKVVDSIQNQTQVPEIVVSTYGDRDPRVEDLEVKTLHKPSDGPWNRSAALNQGVRGSSKGYIFCLDADCVMEREDVAETIYDRLEDGKHVVYRVIYGGTINTHGCGMQGALREWFLKNKWNEKYEGYGREDVDMLQIAKTQGRDIVELAGGIVHLDHPKDLDGELGEMWEENKKLYRKIWGSL